MIGRGIGDSYMVFVLPLESEFGWKRSSISSVYSVHMLTAGLSSMIVGMLYDRWGARFVYCLGILCMGVSYLLAGKLQYIWQFYIYVGVMAGMGVAALGTVPATLLVSKWFQHNRTTAIAVTYAGLGAGTLALVPLSQFLTGAFGWRTTYYCFGFFLLIILPLVYFLPWSRLEQKEKKDINQATKDNNKIVNEEKPVTPLSVAIKQPAFWGLVQVFFFTGLGMYTILVQNVAFLIESGFTPMRAASAYGIAGMLSVFGVIGAGMIADRVGYRYSVTLSFGLNFIGLIALYIISVELSYFFLVVYVVFFGGAQGARGPIVAGLSSIIYPSAGIVYGMIYAFMSIGAATGSVMSGLLFDLTGNYRSGFLFAAMAMLMALRPFWLSSAFKQNVISKS